MLQEIVLLLTGFFLLIKGADWLIAGASSLARRSGISELIIGLTIVAFGTSAPELVVSLIASVNIHAYRKEKSCGSMGGWTFCNHLFILSLLHHFQHMITITSTHNEKIKDVQKLFRSRGRKENKLFIIEGYREISRALKKGYHFKSLFFCPDLEGFKYQGFVDSSPSDELFAVSTQVFSRIAYRENQDGLLALAYMKNHTLEELKVIKNGLYLVIETVEKPGNLGAILRTADGAGIDAVFICDNQTDIYNPNVVRSSLGCLFSTTVIAAGSRETIEFLKKNNIAIYSAALQNSKDYYECDFRKGSAFVMGSEAKGLSHQWRSESDHLIKIPMHGIADSLNVSVSAAILIYEALRQRSKPKTKKIVNKS